MIRRVPVGQATLNVMGALLLEPAFSLAEAQDASLELFRRTRKRELREFLSAGLAPR